MYSMKYPNTGFIVFALLSSLYLLMSPGCKEALSPVISSSGGVLPTVEDGQESIISITGVIGADIANFNANSALEVKWYDDEKKTIQKASAPINSLDGFFFIHGLPGGNKSFVFTVLADDIPILDFPLAITKGGTKEQIKDYKLEISVETALNKLTVTLMEIAFSKNNDKTTDGAFRLSIFDRKTLKNWAGIAISTPIEIQEIHNVASLASLAGKRIIDHFEESDRYFSAIYKVPGMDISPHDIFAAFKERVLLKKHIFINGNINSSGNDDIFDDPLLLELIRESMVTFQYIPTFAPLGDISFILEPAGATTENQLFKIEDIPRLALIFSSLAHERDMIIETTIKDKLGNFAQRKLTVFGDTAYDQEGKTAPDAYIASDRISIVPTLNVMSSLCTLSGVLIEAGEMTLGVKITSLSGNWWEYKDHKFTVLGTSQLNDKFIFGTVAYTGIAFGDIRIEVYGEANCTTQLLNATNISNPGRFSIGELRASPVYVIAYKDENGNSWYDPENGEAYGVYESSSIWDRIPDPIELKASVSDINITLTDGYRFEIMEDSVEVTLANGTVYNDCYRVEVRHGGEIWQRYYASRFGLIKEKNVELDSAVISPDESYFPLAVGNKWRYLDQGLKTVEVVGTETVNNYLTFKVLYQPEGAIAWFRAEGNTIICAGFRRDGQYRQNFKKDVKEMELYPQVGRKWGR